MNTFNEALATILAEYKALRRENELLKKENAELKEAITVIKKTPKFYTVAELAEKVLRCSKTTIYRAIDSGIIRAGYLSGVEGSRNSRKLIPESELPKLIKFKEV